MIRPMKVASRIAATTRPEWTAHHRIPSSAITIAAATRCQSSASEANSSSASGTGPVRRMRDAMGGVEAERAGRRADRVARRLAGLQGAEVHHRLDDEDAPRLALPPASRRRP